MGRRQGGSMLYKVTNLCSEVTRFCEVDFLAIWSLVKFDQIALLHI